MKTALIEALVWLHDHNRDGLFDNNGVLIAAGEKGPHLRSTWNKLQEGGMVEYYRTTGSATRVRITPTGEQTYAEIKARQNSPRRSR